MAKPSMTKEVLESRVQITASGCWLYMGVSGKGVKDIYPRTKVGAINILIHRHAYALYIGAIPAGMDILHTCDTPHCCNPFHLRCGTHTDNMRDKMKSDRQHRPTGECNPKAKLTEDQVRAIRQDPRPGAQIAAHYGISGANVGDIRHHHTWKHI